MLLSSDYSSHAYLVKGSRDQHKDFIMNMLASVLCEDREKAPCGSCLHCRKVFRNIHPDIAEVAALEGKREISVGQIRDAITDAALLPNEARKRVIIIYNGDVMNHNGQNALLKTLEEPPSHLVLILVSDDPGLLLPTVRSRCAFVTAGETEVTVPDEITKAAEKYLTLVIEDGVALVEFSFEIEKINKEDFPVFLAEVERVYSRHVRQSLENTKPLVRIPDALPKIKEAERYLRHNVSIMHISAFLCSY